MYSSIHYIQYKFILLQYPRPFTLVWVDTGCIDAFLISPNNHTWTIIDQPSVLFLVFHCFVKIALLWWISCLWCFVFIIAVRGHTLKLCAACQSIYSEGSGQLGYDVAALAPVLHIAISFMSHMISPCQVTWFDHARSHDKLHRQDFTQCTD